MTDAPDALELLESRLGYRFGDKNLLRQALTHRSYETENTGRESYERLEFLGDSVLSLGVTEILYGAYPGYQEGALAKARATVVSAEGLGAVAREFSLGDFLVLGRGEDASGGRAKTSILSDVLEALIGAVFVDGGWFDAAGVIGRLFSGRIDEAAQDPGEHDYKTLLQELAAREFNQLPKYQMATLGPDHDRTFVATVVIEGRELGRGTGSSKRKAEQGAAKEAMAAIAASHAVGATDGNEARD